MKKTKGENLHSLELCKVFLALMSKAWSTAGKTDKLDLIRIKNICFSKANVNGIKKQITDWGENIFQLYIQQRTSICNT